MADITITAKISSGSAGIIRTLERARVIAVVACKLNVIALLLSISDTGVEVAIQNIYEKIEDKVYRANKENYGLNDREVPT